MASSAAQRSTSFQDSFFKYVLKKTQERRVFHAAQRSYRFAFCEITFFRRHARADLGQDFGRRMAAQRLIKRAPDFGMLDLPERLQERLQRMGRRIVSQRPRDVALNAPEFFLKQGLTKRLDGARAGLAGQSARRIDASQGRADLP